jgi:hypothetical protein
MASAAGGTNQRLKPGLAMMWLLSNQLVLMIGNPCGGGVGYKNEEPDYPQPLNFIEKPSGLVWPVFFGTSL